MKKFILSCAIITSLFTAAFAENIFSHRFFEFKVDVPVSISNNLIAVDEILKKNVVIDLTEIADSIGSKGACVLASTTPTFGFKLDIPKGLVLGADLGIQADVSAGLSEQLFQFFGKGNAGSDDPTELKTSLKNTYADVFAFASVCGGWNGKKLKLTVDTNAFWALAHMEASDSYVRVYNNADKNVAGVEAKLDAKLYSAFDVTGDLSDIMALINQTINNIGFDVGFDANYELFRYLSVGATARVPIVPSRLPMLTSVGYDFNQEIDIGSMMGAGDSGSESGAGAGSGAEGESQEEAAGLQFSQASLLDTPYTIHRPMKLGVSADFHPFGTLLTTKGYFGVGIRHPFAKNKEEIQWYVDYALAGRLSLWNILSFNVSHSCYDQVFKNEFALEFNIRLLEIDVGVSSESTSFAKSFRGAGVGAFVTLCLGF